MHYYFLNVYQKLILDFTLKIKRIRDIKQIINFIQINLKYVWWKFFYCQRWPIEVFLMYIKFGRKFSQYHKQEITTQLAISQNQKCLTFHVKVRLLVRDLKSIQILKKLITLGYENVKIINFF